jgi:hypothetical protein
MVFTKLVPSVFYVDINDCFELFVDSLKFRIDHMEYNIPQPFCVLVKDDLKIMVFQDEQLAKEHYPEIRMETNDIEVIYASIKASHPHLLHPNLNAITRRPWGAKEFAILDKQVGIRIQQW